MLSKLLRCTFALGLLFVAFGGCDSTSSPTPTEDTETGEQIDWPTANPPEGWVVENHYVDPDSTEFNPTVILVRREGQEVGKGPDQIFGSPSVNVEVSSQRWPPPEEIIENRLKSSKTIKRLDNRVIDGVTFYGHSSLFESESGHTVRSNTWLGNIPEEDGYLIVIEEHNGGDDEDVIEELYAISNTITWPDDISWARDKWWSY